MDSGIEVETHRIPYSCWQEVLCEHDLCPLQEGLTGQTSNQGLTHFPESTAKRNPPGPAFVPGAPMPERRAHCPGQT